MHSSVTLCIPARVRTLYLEFLILSQELEGARATSSKVDKRKHPRPYLYMRLDGSAAERSTESTESDKPSIIPSPFALKVMNAVPGTVLTGSAASAETRAESSASSQQRQRERHHTYGFTYRVAADDVHRLDPFLPRNWRTDATAASAAIVESPAVSFSTHYRETVQAAFYQCALLDPDGPEWKRALACGRMQLRKVQEMIHMKRYRAMRKRYDWAAQLSTDDLLTAFSRSSSGEAEAVCQAAGHRVREAQLGLANRDVYGYRSDE